MSIKDFLKRWGKKPQEKSESLVIYFPISSGYGTESERAAIHKFTDELDAAINKNNVGIFDGDEFGGGECGLFMYGPSADALFDIVEPILANCNLVDGGYAIKRYGRPDESERIPL